MTLAGGALFGLLRGTIIVSFASTIGATLACFVSRSILRDWVQGKFGEKLKTVNNGIEREGPFYLFTLRLIPVFPFWMINLVLGLTTDAAQDILLGIAGRHAARHDCLRQCRKRTGKDRFPLRHPFARPHNVLRAARTLASGRKEGNCMV